MCGWRKLFTVPGRTRPLQRPLAAYPPPPPVEGEIIHPGQVDLAIDFGTSAIAAALVSPAGGTKLLRFDGSGSTLLESRMARREGLGRSGLGDDYEVGAPALARIRTLGESEWDYYPCLKRRIEYLARTADSNAWEADAVLDVAACCWRALELARSEDGRGIGPLLGSEFRVFITVPNAFPHSAVEVLRCGVAYGVAAATGISHLPAVQTLWEAEAVAYHELLARDGGEPERRDETLLILDAGAGTTDASIVRSEQGIVRVVAHAGLPVGGIDLDAHLAQLRGGMHDRDSARWLLTARDAKQIHWSASGGSGGPAGVEEATRNLEASLINPSGWPEARDGRALRDDLELGHRRYLALAVDALLGCLPADELKGVTKVVVSGRASLLVGFAERVGAAFRGLGLEPPPTVGAHGDDRKLAVIRGVGDYVAAAGVKLKRRPLRAGFEMVLRHTEVGDPLVLIPAGHPLDEGWGVQAYHQPETSEPGQQPNHSVDIRLIPMTVVSELAKNPGLGWSYRDLYAWSVIPALWIIADPPFTACVAYDFLTLRVHGDVHGSPVRHRKGGRQSDTAGRLHPVHGLDENWFEILHRRPS